jgi:hypothetical protein
MNHSTSITTPSGPLPRGQAPGGGAILRAYYNLEAYCSGLQHETRRPYPARHRRTAPCCCCKARTPLALHPASAHAAAAGRAPVGRRVARAAPDILRAPPVSSARQQATDRPRPRPAIALRQLRTQRHTTKSSGRFSQGRASSGCFLAHIRFRSYDLGVCTARRSSCTHLACRLAQAQGKRTL